MLRCSEPCKGMPMCCFRSTAWRFPGFLHTVCLRLQWRILTNTEEAPPQSCTLTVPLLLCTQVEQLTEVATPLLNTFLQGILGNPVARQALQDLTVTPNLERFIQGLQNLTQITEPPIVSLLV